MINLKTATAQEVFDHVATHLLTQNEKSLDSISGQCMYRGKNGTKCAAGCLIPDEDYDEVKMEGMTWNGISSVKGYMSTNHRGLIGRLQGLHDNNDPSKWKSYLEIIGNDCKLSTEVLEKFTDGVGVTE